MTQPLRTRPRPRAGRLEWRPLLAWLRDDGWISEPTMPSAWCSASAPASSSLHALVRLGGAGLRRPSGKPLWTPSADRMAGRPRAGLPYVRIDPLKADVGRVADVMSVRYAETRCALPLSYRLQPR